MAAQLLADARYYKGLAVIFAIVSIFAFFLNGSVIIVFLGNRTLLTSSNYLLLSMALSDFLSSILVLPVGAYANFKKWWTLDEYVCQYFAFASTLLGLSSMIHLMTLAVQRWMTFKSANVYEVSARKMGTVVGGLWLFSLIWSLFPLLGWSSFGPEPGSACCSISWTSSKPSDKAFIVCLFICFFFFPIAVEIFCYISVYNEVRKMAKAAVKRWGSDALPTQQTLQARTKTVKISFVMVVAFLVAWSPYALLSMYTSFISSDVSPLLSIIPPMFAKFSACYNPLIYFFMYTKFRGALKNMLTKCLFSSTQPVTV